MKKLLTILISVLLITGCATTAMADSFVNSGPGAAKWEQQSDGRWMYKIGSTPITSNWATSNGFSYLFDEKGYMLTGWQYKDGKTYFLSTENSAEHPLGSKYVNCQTPDGHTVDMNGCLVGELGCRANQYHRDCVEVSIGEQAVYLYRGEELIMSTPCVTGKVSAGTITHTGDFTIQAKVRDKTLKGKNVDGTEYASFVHFWMPFNGGEGLHDASWRSNFGGTIYQYGGSHGCVNLPTAAAQTIWDNIYVGTPVYVHD